MRWCGIIQLWRERVYWHDSLLYGEALWNPNEDERVAIHGLEHPHTPTEIASIAAGLSFLRGVTRHGRPVDSGIFRNAGDFRAKVVPIIKRLHLCVVVTIDRASRLPKRQSATSLAMPCPTTPTKARRYPPAAP